MKKEVEPLLRPVRIADLRPTQMTVGLREVDRKRAQWRARAKRDGPDFLGRHMIPAVYGRKERPYLIDQHHLARALHDEGVEHVLVYVVADLSRLEKAAFWTVMDSRNWVHPYDADGKRHDHKRLPRSIGELADDPWRSLAGELRQAGGYAKDNTPYSEFLWADFLRRIIDRRQIEHNFQAALTKAYDAAHKPRADYLPGWCGVND